LAERLLLLEEGHCLREHALHACGAVSRQAPEGAEATSLLTLVQMVESGLGMALIPETAVRSALTGSPNLVARSLARPAPRKTIAIVACRSTSRLPDLKALADVIQGANASLTRVRKG
jgi:LysR family transcriptional regulator, hydrogen peroxide-inducible genes activator